MGNRVNSVFEARKKEVSEEDPGGLDCSEAFGGRLDCSGACVERLRHHLDALSGTRRPCSMDRSKCLHELRINEAGFSLKSWPASRHGPPFSLVFHRFLTSFSSLFIVLGPFSALFLWIFPQDTLYFPFEPLEPQRQLATRALEACELGGIALLQSPTGSGKSLALLCSLLAWQRRRQLHHTAPQIIYGAAWRHVNG